MTSSAIPVVLAILESSPCGFKHSILYKNIICLAHGMWSGISGLHQNHNIYAIAFIYLSNFYHTEIQKYNSSLQPSDAGKKIKEYHIHRHVYCSLSMARFGVPLHLHVNILLSSVSLGNTFPLQAHCLVAAVSGIHAIPWFLLETTPSNTTAVKPRQAIIVCLH